MLQSKCNVNDIFYYNIDVFINQYYRTINCYRLLTNVLLAWEMYVITNDHLCVNRHLVFFIRVILDI